MNRSKSLDGLRGIAILLVVAGHSWEAYGNKHGLLSDLAPLFANSSLGVRLFFVLSGYLITTLLLLEMEDSGTLSLSKFYVRRILRIFPAFYVFLGCILILDLNGIVPITTPQLIAAGTYTWNYFGILHTPGTYQGGWFLGHLWTLSLEEQFYLFWPAILLLLGKKRALTVSVILVALMPFIRTASYFLFPSQRGYLGMMLHTAIDSIMAGCALALLLRDDAVRAWFKHLNWPIILPVALVFVFIVSPLLSDRFGGSYSITSGFTLDAFGATFLILHIGYLAPTGLLAQALSIAPLVYIGRLSYSWYLWQQLFLTQLNQTWTGVFPLSIFCSFLAALGSHYLIERPFLRLKNRFSAKRVKPAPSSKAGILQLPNPTPLA